MNKEFDLKNKRLNKFETLQIITNYIEFKLATSETNKEFEKVILYGLKGYEHFEKDIYSSLSYNHRGFLG